LSLPVWPARTWRRFGTTWPPTIPAQRSACLGRIEEAIREGLAPVLEGIALEGYRSDALTGEQVPSLLGFGTRMQVHGFLEEHGVYLNYPLEDLDQDVETSRELSSH
jgi:hypothetical protein